MPSAASSSLGMQAHVLHLQHCCTSIGDVEESLEPCVWEMRGVRLQAFAEGLSSYDHVRCHGVLTGHDRGGTYERVGDGLRATATRCAANGLGRVNLVVRVGVYWNYGGP